MNKGPSSQSYGFSRCESWTTTKAECQRIDAFELWCWRRLLRVPWTARRYNQSILKDKNTGVGCHFLLQCMKVKSESEVTHARGQGQQPGGATATPRPGAAAGRSYPTSDVRGGGREELPHTRGQRQRPGGATPRPRPGVAARRSYPADSADQPDDRC